MFDTTALLMTTINWFFFYFSVFFNVVCLVRPWDISLFDLKMSNHRLCGVHAFIFSNSLELQQYLNFFFSLSSGLWLVSPCNDSLCTGPVANQSLSFCLAVMHTNSQQHILISPEFKAHQSQLTGPPGPTRAILKKCFILCLSDTCESELMTLHLVSESSSSHLGIRIHGVIILLEVDVSYFLWQL